MNQTSAKVKKGKSEITQPSIKVSMMQQISPRALLVCLIFGLTTSCGRSAPAGNERGTSDSSDPRWRMVSGMDAARTYTQREQIIVSYQPPLVSVSGNLQTILDSVCDLLTVYELVAKVNENSDLTALLGQNIQDSCNWLNYLVTHNTDVTGSSGFSDLPSSCAPGDVTRLHSFCYRMKVGERDQLRHLVHHELSDPLSTYYSGTVTGQSSSLWLQTSSIPADQQSSIGEVL